MPLFLATPVRQPINAEFFTSFRFQIRRGNGGQGADGFAFVIQVRTAVIPPKCINFEARPG